MTVTKEEIAFIKKRWRAAANNIDRMADLINQRMHPGNKYSFANETDDLLESMYEDFNDRFKRLFEETRTMLFDIANDTEGEQYRFSEAREFHDECGDR